MPDSDNIKGLNDLSKKLKKLGVELGGKTLRNATTSATLPAFKAMKSSAPVGKNAHRTYLGRLVTPGFLKRSIRRKSFFKNGKATTKIGVKLEAFYGINFLDSGVSVKKRRGAKTLRPYSIRGRKWFKFNFISKEKQMINRLKKRLIIGIDKAIKNG